jgi:transposase
MNKRYRVTLGDDERGMLRGLLTAGTTAARKAAHARILLKADQGPGGPAWTDREIAAALEVDEATVHRVRKRCVLEGVDAALIRTRAAPAPPRKLDGAQEARLVALACGAPPLGRARWSLRLLAARFVELEYAEAISHETVRRALKKTRSSRG